MPVQDQPGEDPDEEKLVFAGTVSVTTIALEPWLPTFVNDKS